MRRAIFRILLFLAAAGPAAGAARAQTPVDLELVLAVDISGSIDPVEAEIQRRGYIDALTDPRVIGAIRSGILGRIGVTYVEWAGASYQQMVIGWREISDEASAHAFASELAEAPALTVSWTSLSGAIDFSARTFDGNGFEGTRRVIDISGDGHNNRGRPVTDARDEAVAAGIVINGLPILNERPNPWGGPPAYDLDRYFAENVIGGPGAFQIPARSFEDFGRAILSKLLLEIAGLPPE
jgi:Protein of unknown function (DUF1194)